MSSSRVVLVGPRGAGKSTVGPLLARLLGVPFADSDRRIEEESGRGIPDLLRDGTFREREAAVLARLLAGPPSVIAAGGGAVLWGGFREAARGWVVIWLDAPPEVLARRIAEAKGSRPSLTGRPPEEEIAGIARDRAPLYGAVAARRFASDRLGPDALAREIAEFLRANASRDAD